MTAIQTGEQFKSEVHFTREGISHFAKMCGDLTPIHHDVEFAAQSRFGGIIASGPHTTALMMGATATHFSSQDEMVGLDFRFRFRRAVPVDTTMQINWQVVALRPKASLRGTLAFLVGKMIAPDCTEAVRSVGKVLLFDAK